MPKNKVTYGLERVHIAPIASISSDGTITYESIFPFPGAVELTIEPSGDSGTFKADNIDYYFAESNEGYEGTLKCAHIIQEFLTKILGEKLDDTSKVMTETANAEKKQFAMMFEFSGDKKETRHVLYYCSASRPSDGSKTKDGSSVNERELKFKASPRPLDKVVRRKTTEDTPANIYDGWFAKVYEPTAVQ